MCMLRKVKRESIEGVMGGLAWAVSVAFDFPTHAGSGRGKFVGQ